MNNVSLQLQQYRALQAQANAGTDPKVAAKVVDVPTRHPEKTDFFHTLMKHWEASYVSQVANKVNETV